VAAAGSVVDDAAVDTWAVGRMAVVGSVVEDQLVTSFAATAGETRGFARMLALVGAPRSRHRNTGCL
jgi:hypothetical protein